MHAPTSEMALFAHEQGSYSGRWVQAGAVIANQLYVPMDPLPSNIPLGASDIHEEFTDWRNDLDDIQLERLATYDILQAAFEDYEPIFESIRRANRYSLDQPKNVHFLSGGSAANAYLYEPSNNSPKVLRFALGYPVFDVLARSGAFVHTRDLPTTELGVAINFRGQTVSEFMPGQAVERVDSEDVEVRPCDLRQLVEDASTADQRKVGIDASGRGNMLFDPGVDHRLRLIDLGSIAGRGYEYKHGTNLTSVARNLLLWGSIRNRIGDYSPMVKGLAHSLVEACIAIHGGDSADTQNVQEFIDHFKGPEGKRALMQRGVFID